MDVVEALNTLQCTSDDSIDDIKRSYRRLILKHHPDKDLSKDGAKFRQINAAWRVIIELKSDKPALEVNRAIFEQVTLDLFTKQEDTYVFPCRCGENYEVLLMRILK